MANLLTVEVQSGEDKVELRISPNATVFHLAAEAQKALPLKDFPSLSRDDRELEHDSSLAELGIKNGDILKVNIKKMTSGLGGPMDGLHMDLASDTTGFSRETSLFTTDGSGGTETPADDDLGHAWKAPRMGAPWQAVGATCGAPVGSLFQNAVSSPVADTTPPHDGEGVITHSLREVIKKIVGPSGCGPQEVQDLMSIAEDMEKVECEHAGMKKRLARLSDLTREQAQMAQEALQMAQDSARVSLQLRELACAVNSDGDGESPAVVASQSSPGSREEDNQMLFQAMMVGLQQAALQQQQQAAAAKEEEPRSFLMKRGDVEMQEAHQQAQQQKPAAERSVSGSGVASSVHMTKEEMDKARRARAEKLERDQAEKARERQEAEAKSRSREALFNSPFAGATKPMGKF